MMQGFLNDLSVVLKAGKFLKNVHQQNILIDECIQQIKASLDSERTWFEKPSCDELGKGRDA